METSTTKMISSNATTPCTSTRKRSVGKQDLNSFISRSLSCLFSETAIINQTTATQEVTVGTGSSINADQVYGPLKRRKCTGTTQESPSLCSISSSSSTATASASSTPPLPTSISMSSLRQSRSIGKLSQTDSLCSLVGDTPVSSNLEIPRSRIPANTAYSIISSDCSIRSDLDASFDSRARWNRDSDNDSLSYSDDSSHGTDEDNYGWYSDGEEDKDEGQGQGAVFF